jgi:hypothetical protein
LWKIGGRIMSIEFLTNDEKFDIVIQRNTFFFNDVRFEEKWEIYTSTISNLLLLLKRRLANEISDEGKKRVVVSFIQDKPEGLTALLALSAISEEFLLRLFTFVRVADDPELNKLVNRKSFPDTAFNREWSKPYLFKLIRTNTAVAEGLVNLLFEGFSVPILTEALPLFELKKLNFNRLNFNAESLIDSIVRLSKRGSYKGKASNDPAGLIKEWLDSQNISYKRNTTVKNIQRSIDFAIPNAITPKIIIECSYEITTSSGMGDKAKTEMGVAEDIRRYYPNAVFIGFTDGIGWYVRRNDLKKLVSAFNNVFTFKQGEDERFLEYVSKIL